MALLTLSVVYCMRLFAHMALLTLSVVHCMRLLAHMALTKDVMVFCVRYVTVIFIMLATVLHHRGR